MLKPLILLGIFEKLFIFLNYKILCIKKLYLSSRLFHILMGFLLTDRSFCHKIIISDIFQKEGATFYEYQRRCGASCFSRIIYRYEH